MFISKVFPLPSLSLWCGTVLLSEMMAEGASCYPGIYFQASAGVWVQQDGGPPPEMTDPAQKGLPGPERLCDGRIGGCAWQELG